MSTVLSVFCLDPNYMVFCKISPSKMIFIYAKTDIKKTSGYENERNYAIFIQFF